MKLNCIISLFPSKAGGRISPISSGYVANAVFGVNISCLDDYWDTNYYLFAEDDTELVRNCDIQIVNIQGEIEAGQGKIVDIMIHPERYKYVGDRLIKNGSQFFLREGGRIVASGEIIEPVIKKKEITDKAI